MSTAPVSDDVLACEQPCDWPATLEFLRLRAIGGLEECNQSVYRRAVEIDGVTAIVGVEVESPQGVARMLSNVEVPPLLRQRLRRVFDLDCPIGEVDKTMAQADDGLDYPGVRVPGAWDGFELGVRAILGQQISVAAARTLAGRLCERFGRRLDIDEDSSLHYLFPAASRLADADIAAIGMPRRRAASISTFARAVADGKLTLQPDGDKQQVNEQLLALPGIGPWTAAYIRMRACSDRDAFLPGDVALVNAARKLSIADNSRDLEQHAQRWRPWRAYAVVRLWKSLGSTT